MDSQSRVPNDRLPRCLLEQASLGIGLGFAQRQKRRLDLRGQRRRDHLGLIPVGDLAVDEGMNAGLGSDASLRGHCRIAR
jgi:hypothetical protein